MHLDLICHPATPPSRVRSVRVDLSATDDCETLLTYRVEPGEALTLPEPAPPARTDGLWQRTCFELFLSTEAGAYFEFNLSPSGQWAAYGFDGYRAGMRDLTLSIPPHIAIEERGERFIMAADVDLSAIRSGGLRAGISAVIEEADGTKSYWALAHPGGRPDFHHPDSFVLELPAPREE